MTPKYPDITVLLTEDDGNAFAIMGKVKRAMKNAGVSKEDIEKYSEEATSGDYDNLLVVTMQTVNVE
jgi:hypothetical protein